MLDMGRSRSTWVRVHTTGRSLQQGWHDLAGIGPQRMSQPLADVWQDQAKPVLHTDDEVSGERPGQGIERNLVCRPRDQRAGWKIVEVVSQDLAGDRGELCL